MPYNVLYSPTLTCSHVSPLSSSVRSNALDIVLRAVQSTAETIIRLAAVIESSICTDQ